jgi:aspartate-semialdehyde dehydrogenase
MVEFESKPGPSVDEIIKAFEEYSCEAQKIKCHSAPKRAIVLTSLDDRPQPLFDVDVESGMSVMIGRIRTCSVFDVKFTLLVHNTILGAAGSSILNAELAYHKGLLK